MTFCNIHTHHPSQSSIDVTIVNRIVTDASDVNLNALQSVGIHPWYIYNVRTQVERLREVAQCPRVVAIGEAGFDKSSRKIIPFSIQKEAFQLQAELAEELRKPLIIHCVKAWEEIIVAKKQLFPQMPWIIHGFRGKGELAERLIKQGFYLSFGEYFHPEALQAAWPKHIFTETDNKDINISIIYQLITASLQVESNTFAKQIRENVHALFPV